MSNDFYCIEDNEKVENIKISGTSISEIIEKSDFTIDDFSSYFPLKNLCKKENIQMMYLGYFEKWIHKRAFIIHLKILVLDQLKKDQSAHILNIRS